MTGPPGERQPMAARFRTLLDVWGVVALFLLVMVGIYGGIFTPTEAGAMTVVYAALVGLFAHRELRWAHVPSILLETVLATSTVMLIICAAGAFGFYMAWERIPPQLAALLATLTSDPLVLLLFINLLLLTIGMLLEGTAALILLAPILVPVITRMGIDPVHFGLVMVINLTIGAVTPPVGTLMYTTTTILQTSLQAFIRESWPFVLALLVVLALVTYVPELVLFLPRLLMG